MVANGPDMLDRHAERRRDAVRDAELRIGGRRVKACEQPRGQQRTARELAPGDAPAPEQRREAVHHRGW